jgi:hypothetical protein
MNVSQLTLLDPPPAAEAAAKNIAPQSVFPGVLLYLGDCIEVIEALPAHCIDACVTDGPYGIGFMGNAWDSFSPDAIASNTRKALRADHGFNLEDPRRTNPNLKGRERSPAISPSQVEYDRTLEGQRAFQRFTELWARSLFRVLKPGAHVLVCAARREVRASDDLWPRGRWLRDPGFVRVAVRAGVPEEPQPRWRTRHGAEARARTNRARAETVRRHDRRERRAMGRRRAEHRRVSSERCD